MTKKNKIKKTEKILIKIICRKLIWHTELLKKKKIN